MPRGPFATIAEGAADEILRAFQRLVRDPAPTADDVLDMRQRVAEQLEDVMDEAARRARED